MIESLFGYNIQNSMKNDETKSKTPSPRKHVLEPKRLQNITILLKALNVTADQACNALMKGIALKSSFNLQNHFISTYNGTSSSIFLVIALNSLIHV